MNQLASIATALFSWGTLIAQVIIILASLLLISVILKRPTNYLHHLSKKTADHAFLFGFVISLVVLFASLLYSNVVGFAPCELCWWQRVFFFPQVILFGIAFYNEKISKVQDEMVFLYSLVLSFIGAMVALFQYYGQMFNTAILNTCAVEGVSCAKVFFISFGYITMPMMSLTAYLVLILLYFFRRHHAKKKM
jgi:disulfide bond formation protein DsbB